MSMRHGVFLALMFAAGQLSAQGTYTYVSPWPGSVSVSRETNVIVRSANQMDPADAVQGMIIVHGEKSGRLNGSLVLSDDGHTLVFTPDRVFIPGERVTVAVHSQSTSPNKSDRYTFTFTIMAAGEGHSYRSYATPDPLLGGWKEHTRSMESFGQADTYLPAPPITIDSVNNPSKGSIFLAAWDRNAPRKYGNYFFVLDRSGSIQDSLRVEGAPFDFKVQPNGLISYGVGDFSTPVPNGNAVRYYVLDTTLAVIDSFGMKNGYTTDFHEFLLLPNGHALMMSYHTIIYDMSTVVPGGRVDAALVINVLQEQDRQKNVVFEWRNIDHIPITESDLDLTGSRINYSTLNAFDVDTDGNILASFRNHSEIMKISRETGEILWRWGSPRGSFAFLDEHEENAPYYFSRQHNIRRLPNGNISLFDNGQAHSPWYSRAVEYELDETHKTARLVSEYRYSGGDIMAAAAGNAQRLEDGGWFVGYGILHPLSPVKRNVVEVHADGSIALEMSLPQNVIAYRVGKYRWKNDADIRSVTHAEVLQGNSYAYDGQGETTGVTLTFLQLLGESYNLTTITRLPYGPRNPQFIGETPGIAGVSFVYSGASVSSQVTDIVVDCSQYPEVHHPSKTSLYFRSFPGSGVFQQLTTTYDSVRNELMARTTSFGEYVFGEPDVQAITRAPVLIRPAPAERVHQDYAVEFLWTGAGRGDQFRFQLMKDSLGGSTVVDSVISGSSLRFGPPDTGQAYVWRAASLTSAGEPVWSAGRTFIAAEGFLDLIEPDTGGVYAATNAYAIRWASNLPESLSVQLLRGMAFMSELAVVPAPNGGYTWTISDTIQPGAQYAIRIVSSVYTALADTSAQTFSIEAVTHVADESRGVPTILRLEQNYPNPFNPSTQIRYVLSTSSRVRLSVMTLLGQEVTILDEGLRERGAHEAHFDARDLPSGVYIYRLDIGGMSMSRKLVLIR